MKTMYKRTVALTFVLALICSLGINAAMPESGIVPLYNFIDETDCTIDINGTEASLKPSLEGRGTASAVDECAR